MAEPQRSEDQQFLNALQCAELGTSDTHSGPDCLTGLPIPAQTGKAWSLWMIGRQTADFANSAANFKSKAN